MSESTRQLFIVAYPVVGEVGGVLIDGEGNRLAVDQATTGPELVERLAAVVAREAPGEEVSVVPGWDKAPEGLRDRYEAKRKAEPRFRMVLEPAEEDELAAARRALGLDE